MANKEHLAAINKGVEYWNNWRNENPVSIDLREADLSKVNLNGANLKSADLSDAKLFRTKLCKSNLTEAKLKGASLWNADLTDAILKKANLIEADMNGTKLIGADFTGAKLYRAKLYRANLDHAILIQADFSGSNLKEANLTDCNLESAKLDGAKLTECNLTRANLYKASLFHATCVSTKFTGANMEHANIYGISVWDIETAGLVQKNLVITRAGEPQITVDNIEVAQFIYLILNNKKIRDVIGTIAKKGVLILGRFSAERKKILDAIREKLREHDYVPIMFDFEKVTERDLTETIKILAGMSRFVIVDITNPKSAPLELQATVPDYKIPFVPIIQKGEKPFALFYDLQPKYNWVLDIIEYDSETDLLEGFQKGILDRALSVEKRLLEERLTPKPDSLNFGDYKE
ncbi:MAG: pentapeptide repeat-containing protein [Chitinophagaceae bacterium]|nr:pentapeptide repeat-containing protein [Chitinophagaceae bacterium]